MNWKQGKKWRILAATAAIAAASALVLAGCSQAKPTDNTSPQSNSASQTVVIGTTDGAKSAWTVFKEEAAAAGIKLDVRNFSDYTTPNTALAEKQIDVNLFQHIKFLAGYNNESGEKLVPVGSTEIVPLALYYKGHTDKNDLTDGANVAIPNDSTNQGRAINLLASYGYLKLKDPSLLTPSPADIDTTASRVKVTPVDAAQTATAWGEGTPAVVNNTFLERAGIDPTSALFADDPKDSSAQPYINVFVTRQDNQNNPLIQKLVQIWQSEKVQHANQIDSQNTAVSVNLSPAELQKILADTEAKLKEQQ